MNSAPLGRLMIIVAATACAVDCGNSDSNSKGDQGSSSGGQSSSSGAGSTDAAVDSGSTSPDAADCDAAYSCVQNGVCYTTIDENHCGGFGGACLNCAATGEDCLFSPGVEGPECTCLCTANPPVHPPPGQTCATFCGSGSSSSGGG